MKKITFITIVLSMMVLLFGSGCLSGSVKITSQPYWNVRSDMPVKFKFSEVSWNSNDLPIWFNKEKISRFITMVKKRAPELFSDSDDAIPLTFHFNHSFVTESNGGYNFLAFLTLFTVLPGINKYAHKFDFSVKVGPQGEYVEKKHIVLNYEEVVSLIPLYALFIPPQDGSFCTFAVQIQDQVIRSFKMQDLFIDMIYSLDKEMLKRKFSASGSGDMEKVFDELRSAMPQNVF